MKFRPLSLILPAALLFGACGGEGLSDTRHPTGSQVMTTSTDYNALYVAHPDKSSIVQVGIGGAAPVEVELGKQPARVTRAGGRVFVTLRGERKIAVLGERSGSLELETRIDTGAEPFGVVANEAGTKVYVAVSLENRIDEIDAGSLAITRSFSAANQPRWLALHPSGRSLYAASAMGGTLTWIDLETGRSHEIRLPEANRFDPFNGTESPMSVRLTGDPALSSRAEELLVPALYVDHNSPVAEGEDGKIEPGGGGGYDSGRITPVVAVIPVDGDGEPQLEDIAVIAPSAFTNAPVSGYFASVAVDPASELVIATVEGGAAAVAFPLDVPSNDEFLGGAFEFDGAARVAPGGVLPFEFRQTVALVTAAGPRGIAFSSDGRAHIYSFLDRAVEEFDLDQIKSTLLGENDGSGRALDIAAPEPAIGFIGGNAIAASARVEIAAEVLPDLIARGRRMFFATNDQRMAAVGAHVSCGTCHFDGRNDGLTWNFTRGGRQTPSLAGKVSLTAPVRWEGDKETVAIDAMSTSQGLMGGNGLTEADAQAIEAFIDTNPEVDVPLRGVDDESIRRGKAIFEREDVGCASCHNGGRFADNKVQPMFGLPQAKTRSLVGIAASEPYLHDGRAATLRDVVLLARDGSMGNTGALSDAEIDDLVRYLKSL
jgi:mono/diheme cytochrome c family protein